MKASVGSLQNHFRGLLINGTFEGEDGKYCEGNIHVKSIYQRKEKQYTYSSDKLQFIIDLFENMQFYYNSTTGNSQSGQCNQFDYQQNYNLMMQQNQLLMQLFKQYSNLAQNTSFIQAPIFYNPKPTESFVIPNKDVGKDEGSTSPSSDNSEVPQLAKENTIYNKQYSVQIQSSKPKAKPKVTKKHKVLDSEEEYSPEGEEVCDFLEPKISESKNIPKIFGKAILNFISNEKDYANKVLAHFEVDPSDFESTLEHLKKHTSSIADLRNMWIDDHNKFAKVFRVFSKEYIRKHSLSYIFNSRVTSLNKHIKYRHRIQEGMGDPEHFTNMKQY